MNIGEILKQQRIGSRLSSAEAAKKLKISAQHLSRIENNKAVPARDLLELMIQTYQPLHEDAELLRKGAGYSSLSDNLSIDKTAEIRLPLEQQPLSAPSVQLDPQATPIFYTNFVAISSDDFGLVLDAGQRIGPSNEVRITNRIGFSKEHAIKIYEAIGTHIKKMEKF